MIDKKTFQETEKLYHYTSVSAAKKILSSGMLKFSRPKRMNDTTESDRRFFGAVGNRLKKVEQEYKRYCQISLAEDKRNCKGYCIPTMWGHYSKGGHGVCLVFDKQKILSCLSENMWGRRIVYKKDYDGNIVVQDGDIAKFFKKGKSGIFFTKPTSWRSEQEFRIVARHSGKETLMLDFRDSLMAVIVGQVFNRRYMRDLADRAVPILKYDEFLGDIILSTKDGDEDWHMDDTCKLDV